jgi:hypothetical protein
MNATIRTPPSCPMSPKKFVLTRLALRVAMSRLVSRDGRATILPIILNDTRVPPLLRQAEARFRTSWSISAPLLKGLRREPQLHRAQKRLSQKHLVAQNSDSAASNARHVDGYLDTLYSTFELIGSGVTAVQHLDTMRPAPVSTWPERGHAVIWRGETRSSSQPCQALQKRDTKMSPSETVDRNPASLASFRTWRHVAAFRARSALVRVGDGLAG